MPVRFDPILGKLLLDRSSGSETSAVGENAEVYPGIANERYIGMVSTSDISTKWLISIFYDNGTTNDTSDDSSIVYEITGHYIRNSLSYTISNVISDNIPTVDVTVEVVNDTYGIKVLNNGPGVVYADVIILN